MKREQLCELGLTHVQIRAVQKIHGEDLTAMQNKMRAEMRGSYRKDLCETIGRMCEHLNAYHLRRVLSFAANAYQQQNDEVKKNVYYWTCPKCGAHLDPGERCDCDGVKKEAASDAGTSKAVIGGKRFSKAVFPPLSYNKTEVKGK